MIYLKKKFINTLKKFRNKRLKKKKKKINLKNKINMKKIIFKKVTIHQHNKVHFYNIVVLKKIIKTLFQTIILNCLIKPNKLKIYKMYKKYKMNNLILK